MIDSLLWWTGFALWALGALYVACVIFDRVVDRVFNSLKLTARILDFFRRRAAFERWLEDTRKDQSE